MDAPPETPGRTPTSAIPLYRLDRPDDIERQQKEVKYDLPLEKTDADDGGSDKGSKKEEEEPKVSFFGLWRYSSGFERLLIFAAIIMSSFVGAAAPISILFLGNVLRRFGEVIEGEHLSIEAGSHHLVLLLVWLGIAVLFSAYGANALWTLTGENQARRIRHLYVEGILRQDVTWFDQASHGSLTTRLAADTHLIGEGLGHHVGDGIVILAQFVCGLTIAISKGWKLALVTLAAIPSMFIVPAVVSILSNKGETQVRDIAAHAGATAEQAFGGIRTVHAFNLQQRFQALYGSQLRRAKNIELATAAWNALAAACAAMFLLLVFALSFWWGSRLVIRGEMDGSDVLVVFFSLLMGAFELGELPPSISAISNARVAAARIFSTIDRHPTIDALSTTEGRKPDGCRGQIEFRNVTFHYPTRQEVNVLDDFSLLIRPGTSIALVGASGCGKSTCQALIQRWYDVDSGSVRIDDMDVRALNVSWLRSQIGLVGQEPSLFNMSVRQNILMGMDPDQAEKTTNAQVEEVCKAANCHDFIMQLPQGYDTSIGEHGGTLSGGQKQRIAIARALIKNPRILLLDEATSALDTTSEKLVMDALNRAATSDRTIVMVAHRLSTVRHADRIVFLNKGKIVESGNHEELMARRGAYFAAVEAQKLAAVEGVADEHPDGPPDPAEHIDVGIPPHQRDYNARQSRRDSWRASFSSGQVNLKIRQTDDDLEERVKKPFRVFWRMLRPEWGQISFGMIGGVVMGGVNPVLGLIFTRLVILLITVHGEAISPGPLSGANLYAFYHVVLGIVAFFAAGTMTWGLSRSDTRASFRVRTQMFNAIVLQEIAYFDEDEHSMGALTARLATDPKAVGHLVTESFSGLAQLIGSLVTGVTIIFIYSWELTLFNLILLPVLIIGQFYEGYMRGGGSDKVLAKAYGETAQVVTEAVKEIRTVTSLGRQRYFIDRYNQISEGPHKTAQRQAAVGSVGYCFNHAYRMFSMSFGLFIGAKLLDQHKINFYDMFVSLMVLIMTGSELGHASALTAQFAEFRHTARKVIALLRRQPDIDIDQPGIEPPRFTGGFEFNDISFFYPTRPARQIFRGQFSFKGEPNKTVALVGPSGCGKSTVIAMLERWYDAFGGSVSIDGTKVDKFHLPSLRRQLALVSQEPTLFDLTIRENLLWGSDEENVSQAEIEEACRRANAYNFIKDLPQGYDTRVGDKGSQLSGGQKQRIAIARALIRKPRILLLDEATSALDSESEAVVQAALDEAATGQTTVTIAHRLSTIQNADLIVVLSNGRVIEQGTHDQLMRNGGLYSELAQQQM